MTHLPDVERYPLVALAGASKMEKFTDLRGYEYDTIALAMFCNGFVKKAVNYQTIAWQKGNAGDAEYRQRLELYKAARARLEQKAKTDQKGK